MRADRRRAAEPPLLRFCRWALCWMCILLCAGLALLNVQSTAWLDITPQAFVREQITYARDALLPFLAAGACMLAAAAALVRWTRRIPERWLALLTAGVVFLLGVLWLQVATPEPRADQLAVSQAAVHWLNGDWCDLAPGGYLALYPFQAGYTGFLALVYALVGPGNYRAVQLLNAALLALTMWCLYRIAALLLGPETENGRWTLVLCLGAWCGVMYASFVYGNVPSLTLAVLAVWLQLRWQTREGHKPWLLLASGGCIGLAVVLKSFSLIVLAAQAILLVLHMIRTRRLRGLALLAAALLAWQGTAGALDGWLERQSGAAPGPGIPMPLWITMGLQDNAPGWRAPGWYNGYTVDLHRMTRGDPRTQRQINRVLLGQRLEELRRDPQRAAEFFWKKTASQWAEPTYQGIWISCIGNPGRYQPWQQAAFWGRPYRVLLAWMNWFQSLVWVSAAGFLLVRRRCLTLEQLLPGLILLGGFLFQLGWEGKGQYTLGYFLLMLPYASAGLGSLARWLGRVRTRASQ